MSAPKALKLRLWSAFELENWRAVEEHGEACLAEGDEDPEIYGAIAVAKARLSDRDEAERLADAARRAAPEDPSVLCRVTEVQLISERYDEAEETLAHVRRIDPENVRGLTLLCHAARFRRDAKALSIRINALAAHDPDPVLMSILSGELALLEGNQYAAEAHFRLVLSHEPESFVAHLNLAILNFMLGHAEEALPHATAAATIRPESRIARKMTDVLRRFDNRLLRAWFSISVFLDTRSGLITGIAFSGLVVIGTLGTPVTVPTIAVSALVLWYARRYARKMQETIDREEVRAELSPDY